ncbi:MAG: DUF6591 domain-containing protein [Oscillospiraceae bacterium]|jgi:hypothetical protein
MKKVLIGALILLLALSTAGCGVKKKLEQKAGEALVEKILGTAGVDADIEGDQVVFKGDDGQELTIGSGKWPSSDLAKSIPEFKGGNIVTMMEAEDSLYIMIEEISDQDFSDYLEEIKDMFTEETYEMSTKTGMMYGAENGEGLGIMLTYEKDSGMSITVSQVKQ